MLSVVRLFLKSLCSLLIKNMASPPQKPRLSVLSPTPTVFGPCFLEALCRASVALNPGNPWLGISEGFAASSREVIQCHRAAAWWITDSIKDVVTGRETELRSADVQAGSALLGTVGCLE